MNTSTVKGFQVNYFNTEEFSNIRREIFNDGIYDIELNNQNPFIIDAGAHIGLATLFFKSRYPNCKILAIEPNVRSYDLLKLNLEQNSISDVTALNKALDSKERIQTLYIDPTDDKWDSSASFQPGGWKGGYNTGDIKVETITLSSLIKDKTVDLLKLDIEGTEQRVLIEAQDYLKNIKNIVVEFHPIKGQNLEKILKLLRKNQFDISQRGDELKIITAKAR